MEPQPITKKRRLVGSRLLPMKAVYSAVRVMVAEFLAQQRRADAVMFGHPRLERLGRMIGAQHGDRMIQAGALKKRRVILLVSVDLAIC